MEIAGFRLCLVGAVSCAYLVRDDYYVIADDINQSKPGSIGSGKSARKYFPVRFQSEFLREISSGTDHEFPPMNIAYVPEPTAVRGEYRGIR